MKKGAPPPPDLAGRTFDSAGKRYAVLWFSKPPGAQAVLTDAEREVAALVAAGRSNAEVARLRATSARTVANQLASIYAKLGVTSRGELAAFLSGLD
ncbi:MAG TPA: helix-turn-helix transcriptional regulator [Polyangiaceae bacterium]|nr:helix-turn-helix transcriptional regulator [Polyangiaceae bacterium]